MADPTLYFVDPLLGVDGAGNGAPVAPYASVQFCIDDITTSHGGRDAVDGDQINEVSDQAPGVVTTTDDVTLAVIDLATVGAVYGNPAVDAPLIIRGCSRTQDPVTGLYTGLPVANNGGIGGMDGNNGGWSIYDGNAGATSYVHFIDMHLHNTGAVDVVFLGSRSTMIGCHIDTSTGRGIRGLDYCRIFNCNLHTLSDDSILLANRSLVFGNYISTGGADAVDIGGVDNHVARNIIITTAVGTEGISVSQIRGIIEGNSIFSTVASTASGIFFDAATHEGWSIFNNLIEGFSGVGGAGIDFNTLLRQIELYANNSFYNNTDDVDPVTDCDKNYDEDNDLLMAASPFLKEGALTFDNRFNYFKPAIPVRGRSFPNGCRFDRGAVQVRLATEREIAAVTITTIPARTELDPL